MEVTLGTGMSGINSASRGKDNGTHNEDKLDDRYQGVPTPRLSLPCQNRAIQIDILGRLGFSRAIKMAKTLIGSWAG
jgi:hypothetical protein